MRFHIGGLGHTGAIFFGGRRSRGASLAGLIIVFASAIVTVVTHLQERQKRVPIEPGALHEVSAVIAPDLPVFEVLQRAGPPTCKAQAEEGELWVYKRTDAPEVCAPSEGDLVLVVAGDRVLRFTPEHDRTSEVASPQDLSDFRRRYSAAGPK